MRGMPVIAAAVTVAVIYPTVGRTSSSQDAAAFSPSFNEKVVPVDSRDRLIPSDMGGVIGPFAGRAWWQALTYCYAVHSFHAYELRNASDQTQAEQIKAEGNEYLKAATFRISDDRGVSDEHALDLLEPEIVYQDVAVDFGGRPFSQEAARCRVLAIRHERAGE